jgi:hypothetical protein
MRTQIKHRLRRYTNSSAIKFTLQMLVVFKTMVRSIFQQGGRLLVSLMFIMHIRSHSNTYGSNHSNCDTCSASSTNSGTGGTFRCASWCPRRLTRRLTGWLASWQRRRMRCGNRSGMRSWTGRWGKRWVHGRGEGRLKGRLYRWRPGSRLSSGGSVKADIRN